MARGWREMDARHGGSIIDAQIERAVADAPGPTTCWPMSPRCAREDFDLLDAGERDIDESLDLVAIAVRP